MAIKIYKFQETPEMELHLNGGLMLGNIKAGVPSLEGKTLQFVQPTAVTHTFAAPPNGFAHTLEDIRAELEAAVGNLNVYQKDGKLVLQSTNANGVEITGGTARALLGLGADSSVKARVYNPPGGAAPAYIESYALAGGTMVLVVQE